MQEWRFTIHDKDNPSEMPQVESEHNSFREAVTALIDSIGIVVKGEPEVEIKVDPTNTDESYAVEVTVPDDELGPVTYVLAIANESDSAPPAPGASTLYWECALGCKSRWPALTTVEAHRNYQRAERIHPGKRCKK